MIRRQSIVTRFEVSCDSCEAMILVDAGSVEEASYMARNRGWRSSKDGGETCAECQTPKAKKAKK